MMIASHDAPRCCSTACVIIDFIAVQYAHTLGFVHDMKRCSSVSCASPQRLQVLFSTQLYFAIFCFVANFSHMNCISRFLSLYDLRFVLRILRHCIVLVMQPHVSLYFVFLACLLVSLIRICSAICDRQLPVTLPHVVFCVASVCCCFIQTCPLLCVCSVLGLSTFLMRVYATSASLSTVMLACSAGVNSSHDFPGIHSPLTVLPSSACPLTQISCTRFAHVCFSCASASHTSVSLCFVQYGPCIRSSLLNILMTLSLSKYHVTFPFQLMLET